MDNPALDLQNENVSSDCKSCAVDKLKGPSSGVRVHVGTQCTGEMRENTRKQLFYQIDDNPPWYLTTFLGFQHYLTVAGSTISVPFLLTPKMCMEDDDPDRANIISTIMFISGIVTVLQATVGSRLPIIQGSSFSFIIPALAILALPEWQCPSKEAISSLDQEEKTELWQERMRVIQGAVILSSLFEVVFGACGVVGTILKYITPMTIAPAITLIGLSLFNVASLHAATNWGISALTIVLIILFSQYLRLFKMPVPFTKSEKRSGMKTYPLFEVFPMLLAMGICWILCAILTYSSVLPAGNAARTDIKARIIDQSPWFRIPYPFQWGVPTIAAGAVLGMLSGVITGIIESIGDYFACARVAGAPRPPTHAMNRGIFIEGIGCVLAGIWGTGNGTTSFSENIGAMSVTNVGSRRVIQTAGILMIIFGLIGKVGAVFISIPEPIVGGVFCVVFGIVTAVGLSNLQGVDLNSSRNIFIIGFSIFFSLSLSKWMADHPGAISVGVESIDQVLHILCSTSMFIAGLLGFILDNTIPGTNEERGIKSEGEHAESDHGKNLSTYDLPFGMDAIRGIRFFKYLPISPTFLTKEGQEARELEMLNSNGSTNKV